MSNLDEDYTASHVCYSYFSRLPPGWPNNAARPPHLRARHRARQEGRSYCPVGHPVVHPPIVRPVVGLIIGQIILAKHIVPCCFTPSTRLRTPGPRPSARPSACLSGMSSAVFPRRPPNHQPNNQPSRLGVEQIAPVVLPVVRSVVGPGRREDRQACCQNPRPASRPQRQPVASSTTSGP